MILKLVRTLFLFILFSQPVLLLADVTVRGKVYDKRTREPLIGASVGLKGTSRGTVTDLEGEFQLKAKALPLTLVVSYLGYDKLEFEVVSVAKPVSIYLNESAKNLAAVEIVDSRVSQKQKQAPLTIETMDVIAVKETPAANFYEGLAHLKGVDLTSASIGFKIINTRGFNSTSPVRSLQLIDGVDNQSPGLNFSLGNFLGAPELDIQRVDLVVGASGAYYGPNAFNGVINMQTKSPFLFKGLSAQVKVGERNLIESSVRWAQVFKNKEGKEKLAYKLNLFYMQANDWEATNYDATSQSPVNKSNPGGYDAVNRYGDEFSSPYLHAQLTNLTNVGFGYFLRDGYKEIDLVDYKSHNLKITGAAHYKLRKEQELIFASNYGNGTTVYQGDNRFSLRDIGFYQNRIEWRKENRFFLRAYATNEDAGNSYDAYNTALILQKAAKTDENWGAHYNNYLTGNLYPKVNKWYQQNASWLNQIPAANNERLNFIDWYWRTYFADTLNMVHSAARELVNSTQYASTPFAPQYQPGTSRFQAAVDSIRALDNRHGGSGFKDRSALYHVAGEYKFNYINLVEDLDSAVGNLDSGMLTDSLWPVPKSRPGHPLLRGIDYVFTGVSFTVGGNYRLYAPNSQGTIFLDTTASLRIYNQEFGFYLGAERKILDEKLKLSATCRVDKNSNFQLLVSPAATAVYTLYIRHVFRFSLSSALRNPTLSDQYINLNVGRATLLGNLHGLNNVITLSSLIEALNNSNQSYLRYFNIDPVRPEQVRTVEVGYRGGTANNKFYYDLSAYHSWYKYFIGYKLGATVDWPPASIPVVHVYRVATNSKDEVRTMGFTAGVNYYLRSYLGFSLNYSWNRLDRGTSKDSIIPAYNTPEHKYNIGLNGRDITSNLGVFVLRHWGYSLNYKHQSGFVYEGSPQFTGDVPAYGMIDAQVNKTIPAWFCTLKLGASNLTNNFVYQVYGGPRVGRMIYLSVLFDLPSWN